jgi:hypothetical protein
MPRTKQETMGAWSRYRLTAWPSYLAREDLEPEGSRAKDRGASGKRLTQQRIRPGSRRDAGCAPVARKQYRGREYRRLFWRYRILRAKVEIAIEEITMNKLHTS